MPLIFGDIIHTFLMPEVDDFWEEGHLKFSNFKATL